MKTSVIKTLQDKPETWNLKFETKYIWQRKK